MLSQSSIDPRELALRIEVLRVSNKIDEQDYKVYLHHVNQLYGTKLLPTDREKSKSVLINQLQSIPEPSKEERELLEAILIPQQIHKLAIS